MKSNIKVFIGSNKDIEPRMGMDVSEYMNDLKNIACSKFDEWVNNKKPNILDISHTSCGGRFIEGDFYWKISVLYNTEK